MDLNSTGPLTWILFFSIVNTIVPNNLQLVESKDTKLGIKCSHIYGRLLVILCLFCLSRVFPILVSDRFNVRKCLQYIV